ncbi:hypothetical protein [Maricaulis sp.]|uniref:hypothetical protein n=1 Tax=Maricaulis sp. TaxID=1486257 RepID=UPI003A91DDFB
MKARIKIAAAAILAFAGMAALPGVASAGTWHVNAASCPDLREDRADARRNTGRGDVREDYRDRQVISCPAHAWRYAPDRYERIALHRVAPPLTVYRDRSGGYYARNRHGAAYRVDVVIDYPRGTARSRNHRDSYRGHPRRH